MNKNYCLFHFGVVVAAVVFVIEVQIYMAITVCLTGYSGFD